jgi:hypothetical protein
VHTWDEFLRCIGVIGMFFFLILFVLHSWWLKFTEEIPLFVMLGVPGYILARTYIHTLTGVDPSNFNTTLVLFTSITAGLLLALVHGILGGITGLVALVRGFWQWLEARRTRWPTVSSGWEDIGIGLCILVVAFGLWKKACVDVIQDRIAILAKFALVQYEFSYDPPCTSSNKVRWVAPLKDRKELKISNVLIADVQSWTDIRFEISQCEKVPFDQNW